MLRILKLAIAVPLAFVGCILIEIADRIEHDAMEWKLERRLL